MGKLSAKQVENAGPGMHADGDGLYLQVTGDGARSWIFRFTLKGRTRYLGLGSASIITLKRARELADDARRLKAEGIDPIERRREQEAANKVEAAKAVIFRDAAEQFLDSHKAGWKNRKHRQQWENTLETYAYPKIGHVPVGEVDTTLVMKVLTPIWPSADDRLVGLLHEGAGSGGGRQQRHDAASLTILGNIYMGKPTTRYSI